jgi:hypothetical protein
LIFSSSEGRHFQQQPRNSRGRSARAPKWNQEASSELWNLSGNPLGSGKAMVARFFQEMLSFGSVSARSSNTAKVANTAAASAGALGAKTVFEAVAEHRGARSVAARWHDRRCDINRRLAVHQERGGQARPADAKTQAGYARIGAPTAPLACLPCESGSWHASRPSKCPEFG